MAAPKNALLAKLLKNSTQKHTSVMSDSKLFTTETVLTDIPILNLALSGSLRSGLDSGVISVAAPSKHFKSLLSLFMVSAYMKKYPESICLFYDSEFGSPPEYLKMYDIDINRVVHTPITTIEELKHDITVQTKGIERGDKVIIFMDSVGNLASEKETLDAEKGENKTDMTRAKALKSMFRIVTPQMKLKDIPCVVINHTYETLEMFSKTTMSGGCVVEGTKIQMADGTLKEVQDIQSGEYVKTLTGSSEVTHTWNPETLLNGTPECFELEFDDGFKVITSDTHKFLCSDGDQFIWVEAKDLTPEHDIVAI